MKFYPYENGGCGKSFSNAEGRAQKVWGTFYVFAKVLAILKGGGRKRFYPVLRGGMQKVPDPQFSHFVGPPPPP